MKYCKMPILILFLGTTFLGCKTRDKITVDGIWAIDSLTFTKPRINASNELNSNLIVFNKDGTCHSPAFYWQMEKVRNVLSLEKVPDGNNMFSTSQSKRNDIDLDNAPDQDGRWVMETNRKGDTLKINIKGNFFSRIYTVSFLKIILESYIV